MTRTSVDTEALRAFIDYADRLRDQRDQEFVCSAAEQTASDQEFELMIYALDQDIPIDETR